jgi:hypothetical protein
MINSKIIYSDVFGVKDLKGTLLSILPTNTFTLRDDNHAQDDDDSAWTWDSFVEI